MESLTGDNTKHSSQNSLFSENLENLTWTVHFINQIYQNIYGYWKLDISHFQKSYVTYLIMLNKLFLLDFSNSFCIKN